MARSELDVRGLGNGPRTLVGVRKPNERSVGREIEDMARNGIDFCGSFFSLDIFPSEFIRASYAGDQRHSNVSVATRISPFGVCPVKRSGHNRKDFATSGINQFTDVTYDASLDATVFKQKNIQSLGPISNNVFGTVVASSESFSEIKEKKRN